MSCPTDKRIEKSEWIQGLFDDGDIKRQFEIDLRESGGTDFNQHPQWGEMSNEANKNHLRPDQYVVIVTTLCTRTNKLDIINVPKENPKKIDK